VEVNMGAHEVTIPITLFLTVGAVFILLLLSRHKERMTMIEKGAKAEDIKALYERGVLRSPSPLSSLKWGLILVGIGLAVVLGMVLHNAYGSDIEGGIYPGLIALFGGFALILFYFIVRKKAI
jgi:hypothetical protein